jgi:hypothetical protein
MSSGGASPGTASSVRAREAIQSIYNSSDFMKMDYHHPISLHWPSSQQVRQADVKKVRTIEEFSLYNDRALLVTEFKDSVVGTDPKTKKRVRYEAIDRYQDTWVKHKNKWALKSAKLLGSDYKVDGHSQRFVPSD